MAEDDGLPPNKRNKFEKNVLIGVTGSVASIKLPKLVDELHRLQPKPNIQVIATEHSMHFFDRDKIPVKVFSDKDEWEAWSTMQDPVLHIETCTVRAWDLKKPLLFCPAMNTLMWEHPITSEQVERLINLGYTNVPPIKKTLACKDTGIGAMAEVTSIVAIVKDHLEKMK
ncbi:phosphopantothenoylcysteine decarboxylase-like isoform X2 [Stylophora pistillata]|uniref:phosphopantothenoylcysteine decarboxylase-like isoform X2 n=1 Tax=Stylophora pistillata TaxID=50429 RepID=UPI000C03C7E8|nr:phosphopantothenoylcysteine decarboxylase-like isoform X2 [Stylophora pistillata]